MTGALCSNLVSCAVVESGGAQLVELGVRGGEAGVRRPRVQCDSAALARWLRTHALYAAQLYHERAHTLLPPEPALCAPGNH